MKRSNMVWAAAAAFLMRALLQRRKSVFGKTVVITGGSRGLGLALAREFGARGAKVCTCARDEDEVQRARDLLEKDGLHVLALPCDVTDPRAVDALFDEVEDQLGYIDVLVNNAGIIQVGPFDVMTERDFRQAMDVHFYGPLYTCQRVLPSMKRRREGRIVNVSSIGGKLAVPHMLPYDASKFALTGLSEGMRAELARHGIRVTTVCPGLMRTGSPRNADFKGKHRLEYLWFTLADALPLFSMSATRAAKKIVDACESGKAELILTVQAKTAARFAAMFPGTTARVLELVNRALPSPGGIGQARAKGFESESPLTRSVLTSLNERAAAQLNEMPNG